MKRTLSWLVAGALGLSALAGCSPSATAPGTGGGGSSAAAGGDTVKVGLLFELTGNVASYGTAEANGAKMALEEINAAGGVNGKKIQLVEYDTKSDTAETTTLAAKLMTQDKVVAIIGPATSGGMKAQIQLSAQNKVPIVSGSATADDLTVSNGKLNEYVFRTCFVDSYQGTVMAKYAAQKLNAKTAVVLKDTSSDYAKGLADAFDKQFKAGGGAVAATEAYTAKQTDFNAVLTKLKGQQFDVMYVPGYYEELGLIIKQARALGITAPITGGDGYESPKLGELAGAALTDVYYTNHYSATDTDPKVTTFIEAFKKKYNNATPEAFHALGYDTMKFVADAIKRAKTATGADVKAAMAETKGFSGVTGTFDVDPATHNPIKQATIIGYKDGKISVTEKFS